ncbi:MAG: hypothetical protein KAJ10_15570 [Thermodesulfovibrionia bacterium]|nr:hypothetical protein [Thermodesulfovibrionia bacterium]
MSLRTSAHILEEYNTARAAYLKALDAQQLDLDRGGVSKSIKQQNIADLKTQMKELSDEYTSITGGSSMVVRQGVPSAN